MSNRPPSSNDGSAALANRSQLEDQHTREMDRLEPLYRLARDTAQGPRPLEAPVIMYLRLWLRNRFRPGIVQTTMTELGAAHEISRQAAQQRVNTLVELGLVEIVDRRGGIRLYIWEPEAISNLRSRRADPQKPLAGFEEIADAHAASAAVEHLRKPQVFEFPPRACPESDRSGAVAEAPRPASSPPGSSCTPASRATANVLNVQGSRNISNTERSKPTVTSCATVMELLSNLVDGLR